MKLYKVLKAFAAHNAGDVIELDPAHDTTSLYVETGRIEEAPSAADDLIGKAVSKLTETIAAAVSKTTEGIADTIARTYSPKGVRVDAGESESDRRKSFGHFLQCVGIAGTAQSDVAEREAAANLLAKQYGSRFNSKFNEQYAKSGAAVDAESRTITKAALAESSGTTGGYTVPPEYATRLLEFPPEEVVLVGKTDEYPMQGREIVFPVLDQTTASGTAGVTSYFGGIVAKWTAEAATRGETEPSFKDLRLVANELSGYALASRNVLMDNVVALETRLTNLFRGTIAWYRDYAYLQGDGAGKPLGVLKAPALLSVTRTTSAHLKYADFANMVAKMLPGSYNRSMWVLSPSAYGELLGLLDTGNRPVFQPIAGQAAGALGSPIVQGILGRPFYVTEKLPALGTVGDVLLIDPKGYWSATRQDVEVAASEHYRFINNQVTYRFLFRGDGRPWMDTYYTAQDQSTTLSPFVAIAT